MFPGADSQIASAYEAMLKDATLVCGIEDDIEGETEGLASTTLTSDQLEHASLNGTAFL